MRLINVWDYSLREFWDDAIPRYAILSHTWDEDEVSFQDMQNTTDLVRAKKGFEKIRLTCKQAQADQVDWAWVDTCCIDKTSSAELSEAINSMYAWYKSSKVCYAYLFDVAVQDTTNDEWTSAFRKSRWFTRGWTLQELIAPSRLVFYGVGWVKLGEMFIPDRIRPQDTKSITTLVAATTGIPENVLFGQTPLRSCSVAQRLSWASSRDCSRQEDTAYCLLGIFDVNMPLLYGEGTKAFIRLQEEIIKVIDDHSILGWVGPKWSRKSVLAPSHAYFANSSHIAPTGEEKGALSTMTKHGLQIGVFTQAIPFRSPGALSGQTFTLAALNCRDTRWNKKLTRVGMILLRDADASEDRYFRIATPHHLHLLYSDAFDKPELLQTIFIRQRWKITSPSRSRYDWRPLTTLTFENISLQPEYAFGDPLSISGEAQASTQEASTTGSLFPLVSCFGDIGIMDSKRLEQSDITWIASDCWAATLVKLGPESFLMEVEGLRAIFNLAFLSTFAITLQQPLYGEPLNLREVQSFYLALCIRAAGPKLGNEDAVAMYLFRPKTSNHDQLNDIIRHISAIPHSSCRSPFGKDISGCDGPTLLWTNTGILNSVFPLPVPVQMVTTLPIDVHREFVFTLSAHQTDSVGQHFSISGVRDFRGSRPLWELYILDHLPPEAWPH